MLDKILRWSREMDPGIFLSNDILIPIFEWAVSFCENSLLKYWIVTKSFYTLVLV